MVQSLRNVTATPNIPVSSVTTTAPSTWQVTYSVACSQTWPSTCSDQGSLTVPCLPPCPSFPPDVQGKMVCSMPQPAYQAAYVLWSQDWKHTNDCRFLHTVVTAREHCSKWKKNHCWCISEFTASQSAGIYFWNMKSCISITTCKIIAWITWVPHFSTYATKPGLSID